MKEIVKNKKIIAVATAVLVLAVVLLLLFRATNNPQKAGADEKIAVKRGGQSVEVYRGGKMVFTEADRQFEQRWVGENGETPYSYFLEKIMSGDYSLSLVAGCIQVEFFQNGELQTVCFADTPETRAIFDEFDAESGGGSGGSGNDGNGGDPFDGFFSTPSPIPGSEAGSTPFSYPTTNPKETPSGPTPTPDDCPYWRLSYCVYPTTPKPVTTPTPTPQPDVLPPDCTQNQLTGKTVISNELCLTSPTPSPTQ